MTSLPREEKHASNEGGSKTGKLARRARSFKEDFLDILSQMRSPGGGNGGGSSGGAGGSPRPPRSPKARTSSSSDTHPDDKNPIADLQIHVKQVQFALKHFQDVVSRNKLEVLAGNGTIVLESIATIHGVLNSYVFIDQSSTLVSATKQVYQSLANLIKLCDDVLLGGEKAINKQNVHVLLKEVGDAVQNLVDLARVKMSEKSIAPASGPSSGGGWNAHPSALSLTSTRESQNSGRSSLPDIPLTPRERQILEQTSTHSQTHEYISPEQPPPKPPLPPMRVWMGESPPPLPPKKKGTCGGGTSEQLCLANERLMGCERLAGCGERLSLGSERHSGSERLSIRSDESSLGSSDSMLNASSNLDPDDLKVSNDDFVTHSPPNQANIAHGSSCLVNGNQAGWDSSCSNVSERTQSPEPIQPINTGGGGDWASISSSGFTSMRSSSRSYSYSSSSKSSSMSVCVEQQHQASRSSVQQTSVQQSTSSTSVQQTSVQQSLSSTSVQQSVSSTSFQQSTNLQQITSSTMASSGNSMLEEMLSGKGLRMDGSLTGGLTLESLDVADGSDRPPALPAKKRSIREREPSTYDNVPTGLLSSSPPSSVPPPLPIKKKHIMAYMEMFGNCSHSNTSDFLRHSMHSYSMMQAEWQQQQASISSAQSCSFTHHQSNSFSREEVRVPPALPPKRIRPHIAPPPITPPGSPVNHLEMAKLELEGPVTCPIVTNGSLTTPMKNGGAVAPQTGVISPLSCGLTSISSTISPMGSSISPSAGSGLSPLGSAVSPVGSAISPMGSGISALGSGLSTGGSALSPTSSGLSPLEPSSGSIPPSNSLLPPEDPVLPSTGSPLFEFDVSQYLVVKKPEEEGPDIRGGNPDALIVLATKASKNDFLYQEAFLTTYRTFLSPLELIEKLCSRHQRFSSSSDLSRQRASREAFSLLVRVVSDLTMSDLEEAVIQMLMDFVYQLLYKGDLTMAKALRVKILEKYAARQQNILSNSPLSSSHSITIRQSTLLDFKSDQVAEQMTLLDSELFMKIEIPEVLIWAQEQNEERSANLTCFTEHFNKMSYWARSRILEKDDAKERERYVVKFIKIMKHLRKINNFNSYLALLSALDSAPIRRLEWQKHITEGLKEYCALIDSSSSFRAYRQALADTNPPCIPYIGLVLQDLTFVHIGNSDFLSDGVINFSKRWQQFNIVENMKRFKKGTYSFKKNERIIAFFSNFDNHLCEEAMWQMSEKIKPRGSKKTAAQQ